MANIFILGNGKRHLKIFHNGKLASCEAYMRHEYDYVYFQTNFKEETDLNIYTFICLNFILK